MIYLLPKRAYFVRSVLSAARPSSRNLELKILSRSKVCKILPEDALRVFGLASFRFHAMRTASDIRVVLDGLRLSL